MAADRPHRGAGLPLSLRLAWRDLLGGLRGFRVFIACIFIGVTAIVGIGSSARVLSDSLAREGRTILGGDVAFRLVHRTASDAERAWMETQGRVSSIATMRAMARAMSADAALVELKAVDEIYPLTGAVRLSGPGGPLAQRLVKSGGAYGIVADPALLARLGVKVGDRLFVGDSQFQLRGILQSEPDKLADGFGLGPRVIMSQEALLGSGLVQPGSLVRWTYRILLGDGVAPVADGLVRRTVNRSARQFPDAGWRVTTRLNVSPAFTRNINRFAQLLTLVALTALIVGGVGVANAVRGFMERKQHDLAVFKALGATGGYIFRLAIVEVLLAAGIGILLGVLAGAAIPFVIASLFGAIIPIPFAPAVYPASIVTGAAFGVLTALAFALPPLGRVHDTRVSALFRDAVDAERGPLRVRYIAMTVIVAVVFMAIVLATASDRRIALIYLGVSLGALAILRVVGRLIIVLARRAPHTSSPLLRLAIANIHRPGAITQSVVLSLGLGMTLLVALTIMDLNFRALLRDGIPGQTPSFFFLDIQKQQVSDFRKFMDDKAPGASLEVAPMMRGRVVSVKGVSASKVKAAPNTTWALRGDRGITYSAAIPGGSTITAGEWWKPDYAGEPLVSIEQEIAEGIGVQLGDRIVFNILGRRIEAKVASFRSLNWRSFGMNFVFVFSPSTFAGAPHANIATATFPGGDRGERELALLRDVARTFPTVTAIRIRETLDAVNKVSEQISFAVRGATAIALLASIFVLAGAVSAGQRARLYDAVILKTLGATRRKLLAGILIEYGLLGLATGFFALFAGGLAAWFVLTQVMEFEDFAWYGLAAGQAVLLGLVITVILGLIGTWRILNEKPARHLRSL